MSFLELKDVSVSFGPPSNRVDILKDINLSVEENEFVVVIGFSGSGKSTLMNLLSGLQMPSTGTSTFKGNAIKEPGPELGMMFQNYSLLPWLSVGDNVKWYASESLTIQNTLTRSWGAATRWASLSTRCSDSLWATRFYPRYLGKW